MAQHGHGHERLRLTPQRRAVLDAVRDSGGHLTAREVHERVCARLPGTGVATVYRALEAMVAAGAVRELRLGGDAVSRYDGNTSRHDHLRCLACGSVTDIEVRLPPGALHSAAGAHGFEVTSYDLELTGRCRTCRDTPAG